MESSRRDLLNNVAEHRSIVKNNLNAYYSRFSFTPKTGKAFPKAGVLLFTEQNQVFPEVYTLIDTFCDLSRKSKSWVHLRTVPTSLKSILLFVKRTSCFDS